MRGDISPTETNTSMLGVRSPCGVIFFFPKSFFFFSSFIIPSLVVPPAPGMNRGVLLLGLKNTNLHYILAPAVILQSCFSLVPSPEQLMLSQPDLISKTDCDLAVGGKKKKSQANQKSPSAALPWGYSSPINVLFAKITDNSTIKGGRWRRGESKKEVPTLGGKNEREKGGRNKRQKKWERKEPGLLRKNDEWTN